MPRSIAAVVAAALFTSGCGYVGGPLPPLANIPSSITDLAARQRGGDIIAHFTLPAFTTEHIAIKDPLTLDLRVGVWPENVGVETWAANAKRIPPPKTTGAIATYLIPSGEWAGKEVVIAARTLGENGKDSEWSNYVILPVVPTPQQPQDLKGESTATGVRLTWRAAGEHFRVQRKVGDSAQYAVVAPDLTQHEFADNQTTPGTTYSYLVQTIVPLGGGKEAESELTELRITPEAPPPAAPTNLMAVPAPNSIELTWDAAAGEVVGYRIYRAAGPGDLEKLADGNGIPTYSDRAVEHGKTYRYAVSAVDQQGREGPRSAIKEVLMP
jgi:hypothetical protein